MLKLNFSIKRIPFSNRSKSIFIIVAYVKFDKIAHGSQLECLQLINIPFRGGDKSMQINKKNVFRDFPT